MPSLKQTKNYDMFIMNELNRDIYHLDDLIKSMKRYGFWPDEPISTIHSEDKKKLVITDGHNRFAAARTIGVSVWYIVTDDIGVSLQERNKLKKPWTLQDYLTSYSRNPANSAYIAVKNYMQETGIPLGLAISILAGESAGSSNRVNQFKNGGYKIGDQTHASQIKRVVTTMKALGLPIATTSFFIQALSKCLWVKEFSVQRFINKISTYASLAEKQANLDQYLGLIEKIYNRQSQNKINISFLAKEEALIRQSSFNKKK